MVLLIIISKIDFRLHSSSLFFPVMDVTLSFHSTLHLLIHGSTLFCHHSNWASSTSSHPASSSVFCHVSITQLICERPIHSNHSISIDSSREWESIVQYTQNALKRTKGNNRPLFNPAIMIYTNTEQLKIQSRNQKRRQCGEKTKIPQVFVSSDFIAQVAFSLLMFCSS